MLALAVALGVIVGIALGAVGAGGSILTIPLLVYAMGVDVHSATGTSLLIVGASALVGTTFHARSGQVEWPAVVTFSVVGMGAALAGSLLNHRLPGAVILGGLATLMVIVAVRMWQQRKVDASATGTRRGWLVVAAAGAGVGVLTGLFGVGGGFILVPALALVLGLSMTAAVATSLPIIAFNSAAGLVPYVATDRIDYSIAALFIAGSVAGMALGTTIGKRAGETRLREAFAMLMILVAGYLVFQQAAGMST